MVSCFADGAHDKDQEFLREMSCCVKRSGLLALTALHFEILPKSSKGLQRPTFEKPVLTAYVKKGRLDFRYMNAKNLEAPGGICLCGKGIAHCGFSRGEIESRKTRRPKQHGSRRGHTIGNSMMWSATIRPDLRAHTMEDCVDSR
jgi:hypothetical protein